MTNQDKMNQLNVDIAEINLSIAKMNRSGDFSLEDLYSESLVQKEIEILELKLIDAMEFQASDQSVDLTMDIVRLKMELSGAKHALEMKRLSDIGNTFLAQCTASISEEPSEQLELVKNEPAMQLSIKCVMDEIMKTKRIAANSEPHTREFAMTECDKNLVKLLSLKLVYQSKSIRVN